MGLDPDFNASSTHCVQWRNSIQIMAQAQKSHHRYREDMSEMPDWMKKKQCPNRDHYLSGKRILPKNLTGKEKLTDIVDEVFLAYNSARLKEACKLFVERMLEPDVTIGMSIRERSPRPGWGAPASFP